MRDPPRHQPGDVRVTGTSRVPSSVVDTGTTGTVAPLGSTARCGGSGVTDPVRGADAAVVAGASSVRAGRPRLPRGYGSAAVGGRGFVRRDCDGHDEHPVAAEAASQGPTSARRPRFLAACRAVPVLHDEASTGTRRRVNPKAPRDSAAEGDERACHQCQAGRTGRPRWRVARRTG